MDYRLSSLLKLSLENPQVKERFLATLKEDEPLSAFCRVAEEYGVFLTAGELSVLGEESCAAMLRSQNGGGEIEPQGWDDDYQLFFLSIGGKP